MRYTDNQPNYTYPPNYNPLIAPPLIPDDINRQLIRIETRLVKLMHHMGLDTYGNPHNDAYGDPF